MQRFAQLYETIQSTRSTRTKVAAMVEYFAEVPEADAAVAVFLLSGRRIKGMIKHAQLKDVVMQRTGLPDWLISASRQHVGDFAETVQLLTEGVSEQEVVAKPLHWYYEELSTWGSLMDIERTHQANKWLGELSGVPLMLVIKMLRGGLRVGVSERLVQQALAEWTRQPIEAIGQLMLGNWEPSVAFIQRLKRAGEFEAEMGPRPFCLAAPLEKTVETLGEVSDFQIEWKWDGIRAQLIHEPGKTQLWSRGEEYVTAQFPEVIQAAMQLPEPCILDGELLAWDVEAEQPRPFAALQRRLNLRKVSQAMLREVRIVFMVYDALQIGAEDVRKQPLEVRRTRMCSLLDGRATYIMKSELLTPHSWQAVAQLRQDALQNHAEGLMLKLKESAYTAGRKRGSWWKWKVDPLTVDCVLIGAELGSGRRATLYTDYTFAIRREGELVPIAKAYSGLTDAEIKTLDHWIRKHSIGKHGRMRTVEAQQVFELGFEGIARSKRHKSGMALRFPRILRWRDDKPVSEIDSVETLAVLLEEESEVESQPVSNEQLEFSI